MNISLYECANAKVLGDRIYCEKGHHLGARQDGGVPILKLKRGDALVYSACQKCLDFCRNGEPVEPEDRGWVK